MDIDLPDISGIEVTKIILSLEHAKNVPIVAMTSHTEPEYVAHCYVAGMNDFYNKRHVQLSQWAVKSWHKD